jgi:hypothetical protein
MRWLMVSSNQSIKILPSSQYIRHLLPKATELRKVVFALNLSIIYYTFLFEITLQLLRVKYSSSYN